MPPSLTVCRSARRGFTLTELLTVSAVLLVLVGLLVPVCSSDRGGRSLQGNCMSNIKALIQGAKMYHDDHRVCPDALYGISYDGVHFETRLYPNYVKDDSTFVCSFSPVKHRSVTEFAPAINQTNGVVTLVAAHSSYDSQLRNPDSPRAVFEQHYALRWEDSGSEKDSRQLAAREPSDSAVVTWCLYHAGPDRVTGALKPEKMALVGFWDGRVQKLPAERLSDWPDAEGRYPWQVSPKP